MRSADRQRTLRASTSSLRITRRRRFAKQPPAVSALLALGGLSDEATDHVVAMVGPEGALLDALKTIDDQL